MSLFMFDELKALQVSLELAKQLSALFEIWKKLHNEENT
jgi:hypothetical protein